MDLPLGGKIQCSLSLWTGINTLVLEWFLCPPLPFFPSVVPTQESHHDVALHWCARSFEVLAHFPWKAVSRWDSYSVLYVQTKTDYNATAPAEKVSTLLAFLVAYVIGSIFLFGLV